MTDRQAAERIADAAEQSYDFVCPPRILFGPGRVAEAIGTALPPGFTLETGPEVLTARFVRDGRRITYLVNYQADKVTVPVTLASGSARKFDVYNPMDGTIQPQKLPGTLTIQGNASLLVVESLR